MGFFFWTIFIVSLVATFVLGIVIGAWRANAVRRAEVILAQKAEANFRARAKAAEKELADWEARARAGGESLAKKIEQLVQRARQEI
ncbi:MAG: hypothetical protein P4K83_02180 [Terracidiphilus sp.]|nr:hypothetical protein [Terracidiphilus sp.]